MHECPGTERRDGGAEGADGGEGALAAGEHERRADTLSTSNTKALHQQLLFVMDIEDDAGITGDRKGANTAAETTQPSAHLSNASISTAAAARSDRHFSAWNDDDFICSAQDLAAARGSWTEQVPAILRLVRACCTLAP